MHHRLSAASLAALLAVAGCGSGSSGPGTAPEAAFRLRLNVESGAPNRYRVVVATPDGRIAAALCPDGHDGSLRCSSTGAEMDAPAVGTTLTVKAPGFAFVTQDVSKADVERASLDIELTPLAAFETADSYRTGVGSDEGLDAFNALSVQSKTELGGARSVKFYVADFDESPKVYFQDTRAYPLHYDFARFALGVSAPRPVFERDTYHGEDRTALAGTLIHYPSLEFEYASTSLSGPITLEFLSSDDLTPAQALRAHRLVEERLHFLGLDGSRDRLVYVPAGSAQEAELAEEEDAFRGRDALFSRHTELYGGVQEQILNPGVAYGTLRLFTPEALEDAVVSFRDLVVLTRLPNDLPLVGGTITEELQTPLAHVNVAARARGTPNLALRGASSDPRIAPFFDELVRLEVTPDGFELRAAQQSEAEAYWESRAREPFVPTRDDEFTGLPGFDEIGFDDSIRVGVKAANLAELRQLLAETAPIGFAVPFSAYHAYMSDNHVTAALCGEARTDCEEEGRAADLCDAAGLRCSASVAADDTFYALLDRLLDDPELATDTALREAGLNALRYVVRHGTVDPDFAEALDARVAGIFGSAKVRLRSSTNAEDLTDFTGAGLYRSLSAFASGDERASQRIREVWASVFSYRAFEERELWNIDHRAVRMGVAVNRAVDDEVANGVLITQNIANPGSQGMYVNVQWGEVEVTNPDSGAVPEVFSIVPGPDGAVQVVRQRFSTLSPDEPLLRDHEVADLAAAAERVHAHFANLYAGSGAPRAFDLEFKFNGPDRNLLIKQARPYATASP